MWAYIRKEAWEGQRLRGETATDRSVFRITGEEARDFLQNLVTNQVAGLKDGLVYAALPEPARKISRRFLLVPHGDAVLLDVKDRSSADLLRRRPCTAAQQDRYRKRSTFLSRGDSANAREGAFADPRDPPLGWRAYGNGRWQTATDWDAIRVARLGPETAIELQPNETYVLEAGFERLCAGVVLQEGLLRRPGSHRRA